MGDLLRRKSRRFNFLYAYPQQKTVSVKVKRGGEIKELKVWLGDPDRWDWKPGKK